MKYKIPLLRTPDISQYISSFSPEIDYFFELEQKLASYFEVKEAVLLNSATSALHLALKVIDVDQGDFVICPDFTFVASVNPILYVGANPILVDVDEDDWNLSPELLQESLITLEKKNKLPKAIIIVHAYGVPAKVDEIKKIAEKYSIPLIEDAAGALGSSYNGKKVGALADIGVVSFNNNKIVSGLGGGVLLTNNSQWAAKARLLSAHNKQYNQETNCFTSTENGFNYRMGLMSAARIFHEFDYFHEFLKKKERIANEYKELLNDNHFSFQKNYRHSESNYWLTSILVENSGLDRINALIDQFSEQGIELRNLWTPLHLQPFLKQRDSFMKGVSLKLFQNGVSLPSSYDLDTELITEITKSVKDFFITYKDYETA